jgi:glutamate racemase
MSAYGYESVAKSIGIPVVEVIGPGSAAAAKATRNNRIGVIGTAATISSGIYPGVIKRMKPEAEVFMKACPLFVPLAEEGPYWWGHDSARLIAGEYLGDLRNTGIDSLILGCTHYPLLSGVIREAVGDEIALISSAKAVAAEVSATLGMSGILRGAPEGGEQPKCGDQLELGNPLKLGEPPDIRFYTSDSPEKFRPLCESILGEPADKRVFRLEIEKYESELP